MVMDIVTSLATSRLIAQQRAMDVTANNLANANTPGYRTTRVLFSDWIDRAALRGANVPAGDRTVVYTQDRATWRETQPGTLTHTSNPLDLAITGPGYFTVSTPNGPRLTRDGRFGRLPDGTLADSNGNAVLDSGGQPILLGASDTRISVTADGSVSSENGSLGRIGVVEPADPMRLSAEGATTFVADTATAPSANPAIVQGSVEESNVQPVMEITRMIDNTRQFQLITQFVQAEADRQQSVIDKVLPQAGA
jgi:flagellar basal-body rod protein FlgF